RTRDEDRHLYRTAIHAVDAVVEMRDQQRSNLGEKDRQQEESHPSSELPREASPNDDAEQLAEFGECARSRETMDRMYQRQTDEPHQSEGSEVSDNRAKNFRGSYWFCHLPSP